MVGPQKGVSLEGQWNGMGGIRNEKRNRLLRGCYCGLPAEKVGHQQQSGQANVSFYSSSSLFFSSH